MFFDEKSRVFKRLKSIFRDLHRAESDIKRKNFEDAFKELRIGFLENKQFISWLKKHQSEKIDSKNINESMFPKPIKKLLKGLEEGRKRGAFVLITFLRSLNFSPDYINNKVREWNKLNDPPLKEGYIKSQIDWHLKQRKKILPPNYSNNNFYKDLKLLDEEPKVKNPLVDVVRQMRKEY